MKMAFKNNNSIVRFFILGTVILITAACNFPLTLNKISETQEQSSENSFSLSTQELLPNTGTSVECISGIIPGKSIREDVVSLLGEPLYTKVEGSSESLYFASAIKIQYNTVILEDSIVSWISLFPDEGRLPAWSEIESQFGEPEHTAYSYYSQFVQTYSYPSRGMMFLVDFQDTVVQMDCFIPLSKDAFIQSYGHNLPVENPYLE